MVVSLNSRLECNNKEEKNGGGRTLSSLERPPPYFFYTTRKRGDVYSKTFQAQDEPASARGLFDPGYSPGGFWYTVPGGSGTTRGVLVQIKWHGKPASSQEAPTPDFPAEDY